MYGSALAVDAKDNQEVGRIDDSHQAFRFVSRGGVPVGLALNQRFGPDNANPGLGYSHGTGGTIRVSLQRVVNGMPSGTILASLTLPPSNPHTDAEVHTRLALTGWPSLVAGDTYVLVIDNIDADPVHNWRSFNVTWNAQPDSPRQPAYPDAFAVLERGTFTGNAWRVATTDTPVFDLVYADGGHDGEAYSAVITGYEVAFTGATKVREHFTYSGPDRTVTKVALRLQRVSGTGTITATLAGGSATATDAALPAVAFSSLTGGRWVTFLLTAQLVHGQTYDLTFSTTGNDKVMPIRAIDDAPWGSREFTDGEGQVNRSGSWLPIYGGTDAQDLQFYLQ